MVKLFLAGIALVGHVAIGTILINRLHSTGLPYWFIKIIDAVWVLWHALVPFIWIVWILDPNQLGRIGPRLQPFIWMHLVLCAFAAVSLIPGWLQRSITRQMSPLQLSNDTQVVDMVNELGHLPVASKITRAMHRIPFNEIMQLHVNEKKLAMPRLDPRLDGMTITHLSDVHFTGDLTEEFHHEVVRRANELDSDIIAVTGDLIDKRRCMSWLSSILGQLKAEHGTYFVLGNHDLRVRDEFGIRNALTSQGLIDLGRRWTQIEINGSPIVLAGNELPWFGPAADMRDCPPVGDDSPLRILLSHAPDQFDWARTNHIDLMLAGHTHGGQVQFPIIGPVLSPSRYGVKYASGTFYEAPTLMHVSRGISGTRQIRMKAAPELTKLVLTCKASSSITP